MIQRIRRSRLLPSLVAALVAATMAGGVASAVTEAKADDETITMCVSALGTKIRFVHTSADCTSGELIRTWNVQGPEGPRGSRGLRGNTGATGPTGPSGPAGAAGTSTSAYTSGTGVDTATSFITYVANGVAATPITVASATPLVPGGTHPYLFWWSVTGLALPDVSTGCGGVGGTAATYQLLTNGVSGGNNPAQPAAPVMMTLASGTNTFVLQITPGVCAAAQTVQAGATISLTNRRMIAVYGG